MVERRDELEYHSTIDQLLAVYTTDWRNYVMNLSSNGFVPCALVDWVQGRACTSHK